MGALRLENEHRAGPGPGGPSGVAVGFPPRAEPSASDSGRPRHLFAKRFRHLRMYFVIAWWLAPGLRDTGTALHGAKESGVRVAERVPDSRQDVNGGGPGRLCVGSPRPAFLGVRSPHFGDISLATSLCRERWGGGSSFTPHFPAPGKMRPCYLGGMGEWILVGHQQC